MVGSVFWRAALLQALTLTVVALILGAALDREFFLSWGWIENWLDRHLVGLTVAPDGHRLLVAGAIPVGR